MTSHVRTLRPVSTIAAPPRPLQLWVGGSLLLWLIYAAVFMQTVGTPAVEAFRNAAVNVLPLALLAAVAHRLIAAQVVHLSGAVQVAAHGLLGCLFALGWYSATVFIYAALRFLAGEAFVLVGFSGPGLTWQIFQGLILYALVAATTYALRTVPAEESERLERYLVRRGDGLAPVLVADILTITGAQDYAEVTTREGRHLVRMSLNEFERRLDPKSFKRVHRSAIVNLDHLERAEPAGGGRMVALMANGDSVPVSRAGSLALRSLAV